MFLLAILRAPLIQKILLVSAAGILFLAVFAALPNYLRERYLTLAEAQDQSQDNQSPEPDLTNSAASSTRQREALLLRSISVTLEHPLLGVGLGNFAPYVNEEDRKMGVPKEPYLGTHNTYTQLSSEAGIPALAMFLGILVIGWRKLGRLIRAARRDTRPEAQDVYRTALAAEACLAGLCTFLLFFQMAYDMFPDMIIGVALVASSTGESELKRLGLQQSRPLENTGAAPPLQASTGPRRVIRDSTLRSR
jgi:O-antigen ligase